MKRFSLAIAMLVAIATVATFTSNASAQGFSHLDMQAQPSDSMYDFDVYVADPVEPVYRLKVRRPDGTWEFILTYGYNAASETSYVVAKEEWSTYNGAYMYGLRLERNDEATDFVVVEHWPSPNWTHLTTVGTMEEAEFLADLIEYYYFGKLTKIEWFQTYYFR